MTTVDVCVLSYVLFFFFNDTATTEIYTLSLHDALPIYVRHQVYPKVSGSWVISEEPWWRFHWLDQVRLRGAFGESGKQPDNFAALQTYAAATGPGDAGVLTPQFVGNA